MTIEVTLEWLKKHGACPESQKLFLEICGEKGSVSAKEIVEGLRRIEKPSWLGWLMAHDASFTHALVEQGADMRICEDYPLRKAAALGNLNVVEYLIEHGADVHALTEDALCRAVDSRHFEVIRCLVRRGAKIEIPLRLAEAKKDTEIVGFLKKCLLENK